MGNFFSAKGFIHCQPAILISLISLFFFLVSLSPAYALKGQININSASSAELIKLPLIGDARAKEIINYRRKHGPYRSVDELLKTEKIGPDTFEAVKPYVTISGRTTLSGETTPPRAAKSTLSHRSKSPPIRTRPGDIKILVDSDYYETLVSFIYSAHRSIQISMYLFKTTPAPGNRASKLIRELAAAEKRGVRVKVVLEKSDFNDDLNKENQKTAKRLKKYHIEVAFDSPGTTSHAKVVIIDKRYCFVGSHNFTHSALKRNHEVSLLIDSTGLAHRLGQYIDHAIKK